MYSTHRLSCIVLGTSLRELLYKAHILGIHMNNSSRLLLHPLFLLSLVALIINDHVLKAAIPSVLTGKLSDFAGLFVFPIFIAVIGQRIFHSRRRLLILHLVVAIVFLLFKVAPIELLWTKILTVASLPLPDRTKDVTDLIALSILPISYWFIIHRSKYISKRDLGRYAAWRKAGILGITAMAIMATTPMYVPRYSIAESIDLADRRAPEVIFTIQKMLNENGFEPRRLTSVRYREFTMHVVAFFFEDKLIITSDSLPQEYSMRLEGGLYFTESATGHVTFDSVSTSYRRPQDHPEVVDKFLRDHIIQPIYALRGVL